jgi:hypothetical protein
MSASRDFFSSEPGAPKWYFEKLYFPNLKKMGTDSGQGMGTLID